MSRILDLYTKLFGFWVILFAILAYFFPQYFIPLKPGMDWFFTLTMFGMGMVLEPKDFKNTFKFPGIILLGMVAQYTIMPFLGFSLTKIFHLPSQIALGVILTGCAPGAMSSNIISYLAHADVAYSVCLTALSTLISPFATPSLTYLLAQFILKIDFWKMFFNILLMVVIPLFVGFGMKNILKERINPFIKIFPAISVTFIIFICSLVVALNQRYINSLTYLIVLTVLLHNILGYFLGYAVGKVSKLSLPRRRTLSIEVGMQNAGLGVVLAIKHFGERSALPAAVFVILSVFTASLLASYWQRK
ncbi:MAG: bile acid:sodium symporter family protein [Candidatus Omnitrophica bacterium]|nr:bile acid:sodium symporter family protein [Candidatus Omnitrophota bacterium]MCM8794146.1 bile acid:sodium symporter family protein [Candidatus Omnitrophota bacterium]